MHNITPFRINIKMYSFTLFRLYGLMWEHCLCNVLWMVDIVNLLPCLSSNVSHNPWCSLWYVFCTVYLHGYSLIQIRDRPCAQNDLCLLLIIINSIIIIN